jgi:hypothetical protein
MQNLYQSTWDHEILYSDRSLKDETIFVIKKYECGGQLKFKTHILFCRDNS